MSYEESKLLSLLKKQDIDSLFLEATNYLCQTKSLFEEKKQLQQKNEQLKERIEYLERSNNRREDTILEQRQEISDLEDNWNELKENEKDKIILDKDMFGSLFPIGTIYYSYDKEQKFPYGEWEYRGCNSMAYLFKRIK